MKSKDRRELVRELVAEVTSVDGRPLATAAEVAAGLAALGRVVPAVGEHEVEAAFLALGRPCVRLGEDRAFSLPRQKKEPGEFSPTAAVREWAGLFER